MPQRIFLYTTPRRAHPLLHMDPYFASPDDLINRTIRARRTQLLIAAIPQTRTALLDAEFRHVHGIGHMVIGKSKDQPDLWSVAE